MFKYNEDNYTIPEPILSILKNRKEVSQTKYILDNQEITTQQQELTIEIPLRETNYYTEFIKPENEILYTIQDTVLFVLLKYVNDLNQRASYILTASTIEPTTFNQTKNNENFELWKKLTRRK